MAPRVHTSPGRLSMDVIDFPVKRNAAPAKTPATPLDPKAATDAKPTQSARKPSRSGAFGISRGAKYATPAADPMEVDQVHEIEEPDLKNTRAPKRAKNDPHAAAAHQQPQQQAAAVPPTRGTAALASGCVFDSIPDKKPTPASATKEAHAAAPPQPGSEAHRKPEPSASVPPPAKKRGRPPKVTPAEGSTPAPVPAPVTGKKRGRPAKMKSAEGAATPSAGGAGAGAGGEVATRPPSPGDAPTPREHADTPPPRGEAAGAAGGGKGGGKVVKVELASDLPLPLGEVMSRMSGGGGAGSMIGREEERVAIEAFLKSTVGAKKSGALYISHKP
ncbi:hypothetical protein T484DRAFT_1876192 [Baffinella frigidus]|nr:hypothetical protein T484DRAFT_1876192 [Cryptophyta sp. CCMP2293]